MNKRSRFYTDTQGRVRYISKHKADKQSSVLIHAPVRKKAGSFITTEGRVIFVGGPGSGGGTASSNTYDVNPEDIIRAVYEDSPQGTFSKPDVLYHFVGGSGGTNLSAFEFVKENGMEVREGWSDINELIPNRPKGIFFWGPEMKNNGNQGVRIEVDINKIDTNKLWAFPSELAQVADGMASGHEYVSGMREALQMAKPIPYAKYTGRFAPEWIYTDNIDSNQISE